jgi:HSP20 family protein
MQAGATMIVLKQKKEPYHSDSISSENNPTFLIGSVVNWQLTYRSHLWRPPTDMYETEENIFVRVEIAGMEGGDISISLDQNILTISGTRPDLNERRAFHQMEINFGEFRSQLEIPVPVQSDLVEAEYVDGFLRVTLPKALPKTIKINKE